ncbi:hypothetical protein [Gemmatimonas sp.]|uniref:hypothetical protein n=1 Tax=Gemmatimonas sp. TaxID=1962908 RepID=UPI0035674494
MARGIDRMTCSRSLVLIAAGRVVGPCLLLACAPATPTPAAAPAPEIALPAAPAPAVATRVLLPRVQPRSIWTVSAVTQLKVTGAALPTGVSNAQRVDTRAVVSMFFDRSATGALRGSGQIDSFTVRSSITERIAESAKQSTAAAIAAQARPTPLLIDALIDSTSLRVVTRPPLVNECDRPEVSAMQLARELLVRIPDGVAENDQWRDSTVTLVCRNGMPLTVYTTTRSTLEKLSQETLVVKREINTKVEGKGGTAFRAFELVGSGSGSQRIEIAASSGLLERLQGTSTLTMQVVERIPPGTPRLQQVLQRVELRAERQR